MIFPLAIFLDFFLGDPKNFFHPVIFIGKIINFWRRIFYTGPHNFKSGLFVCLLTIFTTSFFVWLVLYFSGCNFFVRVYLLYAALAWRDLKDETAPIFFALVKKNIPDARKFLSFVVGRDTKNLDEKEITRATIETIAENSIDGIISVLFFAAIGQVINNSYGMCLCVWIFKAVSTLDSMIGYEKFHEFGKASARLDDAMNFFPARIGGMIIILSGGKNFFGALKIFLRDRKKHKSPNSAHGESAFAGVLGVRLGGGAFYGGKFEARPFINETGREVEIFDIVRAWRVLDVSCAAFAIISMLFMKIS